MKINLIHSGNYNRQNFGARLTKDVQRGFDNLEYEIRRDYGTNCDKYVKYRICREIINNTCTDSVLDYSFDTTPKSNDEYALFPFTFLLVSKDRGKQNFSDIIKEKTEEGLYSMRNLKILARGIENLGKNED